MKASRTNRLEIREDVIAKVRARIKAYSQPNINGCWEWQLSRNKQGYGSTTDGIKQSMGAHRVSYAAFIGPIPAGFVVRHACDNPPCVNPDHLEVGYQQLNVDDCISRGRANFPKEMEFCKKGLHKMEGWNILKSKKQRVGNYWRGPRQCRACKNETTKRWAKKQRLKAAEMKRAA